MPSITTRSEARALLRLPFCYLCGKAIAGASALDHDHVPPKSIFAKADRDFPLKLPTHKECNGGESSSDEVIGQLVSLLHGRVPTAQNRKLQVEMHRTGDGRYLAGFHGLDVETTIFRWVRGFHAALYREPLAASCRRAVHLPLPRAERTPAGVFAERIRDQQRRIVELIKRNRAAETLDRVQANNDKLRYECVWEFADDGTPICVFALNLYDWIQLGDIRHFPARGCVGFYVSPTGCPSQATTGTGIEIHYDNVDFLDPFGG